MRSTLILLPVLVVMASCNTTLYQASFHQPAFRASVDKTAPFLKVHTEKGEVFVLSRWQVDEKHSRVKGDGLHYDIDREVAGRGELKVPFHQIVMLETNKPERVRAHRQLAVMSIVTVASIGITIYCIAQLAVCFSAF